MIKSMTGFARETQSSELGESAWKLRSVNHRFLELYCACPRSSWCSSWRCANSAARCSAWQRGKLMHLGFKPRRHGATTLDLNRPLVEQLAASREVAQPSRPCSSLVILDLLRLAWCSTSPSVTSMQSAPPHWPCWTGARRRPLANRDAEGRAWASSCASAVSASTRPPFSRWRAPAGGCGVNEACAPPRRGPRTRSPARAGNGPARLASGRGRRDGPARRPRGRGAGVSLRRAGGTPAGLPHAGAQSRGQHPGLQVRGDVETTREAVEMKVVIEQRRRAGPKPRRPTSPQPAPESPEGDPVRRPRPRRGQRPGDGRWRDPEPRPAGSCTTRAPRTGEEDGVHYHFLDRRGFEAAIAAGELLEHAEVFGNLYGTRAGDVTAALESGRDLILEIDWQGARQVRQPAPGGGEPRRPAAPACRRRAGSGRLRGRGTDAPKVDSPPASPRPAKT